MGYERFASRPRLYVQQVPTADAASWVARYTACSDQIFTSQRHQRKPQCHKRHTTIGSTKKSSKHPTKSQQNTENKVDSGLDLSDLDLSSIQLSEKEMKALSGLTPALSRRLQQQLLAQLPPAAARTLRRTLSLHNAAPPRDRYYTRSHSATKSTNTDSSSKTQQDKSENFIDKIIDGRCSPTVDKNRIEDKHEVDHVKQLPSNPKNKSDKTEYLVKGAIDISTPQFCTLPRIKRDPSISRETTPITSNDIGHEYSAKLGTHNKDLNHSRGNSIHSSPDRPLLSKYLTPERNISLDESYSSDSCSILSEPSYIAAYGAPNVGSTFRRHSMRLANDRDVPRKRISRFLRPDFFETPSDESLYAKHKKEKELETQKILREIREKKNKMETSAIKSPIEMDNTRQKNNKDEDAYLRKSLSPISILAGKERSRSITPFYPILDNIKEATLDTSSRTCDTSYKTVENNEIPKQAHFNDDLSSRDSKLMRPKSYPAKTLEKDNESQSPNILPKPTLSNECNHEHNLRKESKLIRPKSYPSSSPSPEKIHVNHSLKKDDPKNKTPKEEPPNPEITNDVEVSFSISLPKKTKHSTATKTNSSTKCESFDREDLKSKQGTDGSLIIRKYQVLKSDTDPEKGLDDHKSDSNKGNEKTMCTVVDDRTNNEGAATNTVSEKDEKPKLQNNVHTEPDTTEKKGTIKKRIIKKVSLKSKTDTEFNPDDLENTGKIEKKRIAKNVKVKSSDDCTKITVPKKKSVFQSIGHKLEKLASSKSNSPEKISEGISEKSHTKIDSSHLKRTQREQSVPASVAPIAIESNVIKRAVTLTDVAALEATQPSNSNKTAVSKVLGLFKKFDIKDKTKIANEKSDNDLKAEVAETLDRPTVEDSDNDKPKRPTSLLLNGLGRKNKYVRTASDSVSVDTTDSNPTLLKIESDSKNIRNSLKLDFSRLPRVNKIVPANPVIEPQIMNVSLDKISEKTIPEKNSSVLDSSNVIDEISRSRSRSRSTFSNSDIRSDHSSDKIIDKNSSDSIVHHPIRNHESTTPDKEDIIDRIRRKSFYSRFNEKKQRRKSNLVGPGATEYDPVARIYSQPIERDSKYDTSPSSPGNYDLSPVSIASDLSPSTERYRSLLTDLPSSTRSSLRYDPKNYTINDKIDTYRSLDRSDFRKYPSNKSYIDCDQPSPHESQRYGRTKSLLDSSNDTEDRRLLGQPKDQYKYNRTISMYSPGNFATYRPKRIRNSAIIMKESEKEPSPENILDKIRQRKKLSISVTRTPDPEKECLTRPNVSSKGESDGTECFEKTD